MHTLSAIVLFFTIKTTTEVFIQVLRDENGKSCFQTTRSQVAKKYELHNFFFSTAVLITTILKFRFLNNYIIIIIILHTVSLQ